MPTETPTPIAPEAPVFAFPKHLQLALNAVLETPRDVKIISIHVSQRYIGFDGAELQVSDAVYGSGAALRFVRSLGKYENHIYVGDGARRAMFHNGEAMGVRFVTIEDLDQVS